MRLAEIAAEARGATLEIAARAAAGELLEEVLDQVLLRELLDDLDLLDPHGDLARDRAAELDAGAPFGDEQADQLAGGDERDREPAAAATACELRPELGETERLPRAAGLRIAGPQVELLARRVEQVHVARARREERTRVQRRPSPAARRARRRARSPPRARSAARAPRRGAASPRRGGRSRSRSRRATPR